MGNTRRYRMLAAGLALAWAACGCAVAPRLQQEGGPTVVVEETASPSSPVLRYLGNRALDAVDMFGLRFSFGKGFVFNPQLTKYASFPFAIERYRMSKIGFYGREAGGWKEQNLGGGFLWFYDNYDFYRKPYWGTVRPCYGKTHKNMWGEPGFRGERDIWDVGVTFHIVVGVGFDIRLDQMVDFAAGVVGIDPAGDDR
jgi:hypothetical protein